MTVHIHIEAKTGAEARAQMADLFGGPRLIVSPDLNVGDLSQPGQLILNEAAILGEKTVDPAAMTEVGEKIAETQAAASAVERVRGQPSPGKARRTKAEIAEDDAAAATGPLAIVSQTDVTAEESNLVEDSPEVQAADAADEAAETAAAKVDGKLTLDDVRNALGLYVGAFGMAAAQADGPVLIAKVLGVEHNPAAPKKISDLGDDQVLLRRAVDGVSEMITKNPFSRTKAA